MIGFQIGLKIVLSRRVDEDFIPCHGRKFRCEKAIKELLERNLYPMNLNSGFLK